MLQKCKIHESNYVNGKCIKCEASGAFPFSNIFKLELLFKKSLPEYKSFGAYALAYKTYEILRQAVSRKSA